MYGHAKLSDSLKYCAKPDCFVEQGDKGVLLEGCNEIHPYKALDDGISIALRDAKISKSRICFNTMQIIFSVEKADFFSF